MGNKDLGVKVEARFAVGEYQIVILSAKDSTSLIRCEHPQRGRWGDSPTELAVKDPGVQPALGLAFVPRGKVPLAAALVHDEPDLGVHVAGGKPKGCQTSDPGGLVLGLLLFRPLRRRKR
jgi:hypothetical protein